ncbi:hypothetical protein ACWD5V_10220 [Streptomyces sp. NPDC002523]
MHTHVPTNRWCFGDDWRCSDNGGFRFGDRFDHGGFRFNDRFNDRFDNGGFRFGDRFGDGVVIVVR